MSYDPRLLLIDMTSMHGNSATSMLKQAYFGEWTPGNLLHLQSGGWDSFAIAADNNRPIKPSSKIDLKDEILNRFRPEIILYRPVADKEGLHGMAMNIIEASDAPLALWMMDDWPARFKLGSPDKARRMDADLRRLFARSSVNYAISEGMALAFKERYGVQFEIAHNGVRRIDWAPTSKRKKSPKSKILMRYSGSLAPDTTSEAVYKVAEATAQLVQKGSPLQLEIRTQDNWYNDNAARFKELAGVSFSRAKGDEVSYRNWLQGADMVLLAYNFDDATKRYLRYSFANKAPELLASGAVVLAFGPPELETIDFFKLHKLAHCVVSDDEDLLAEEILKLVENENLRLSIVNKARAFVLDKMDIEHLRDRMKIRLIALTKSHGRSDEGAENSVTLLESLTPRVSIYRRAANGLADHAPLLFRILQKPAHLLKRVDIKR